ncbi:MAG: hypothetical protein E6G60_00240, partial [Actinobacteria bacterium]
MIIHRLACATVSQEGKSSSVSGSAANSRAAMDWTGDELARLSDGQLVTAIGRLSDAALEEVYRRHVRAVISLTRGVLGDQRLAEEVTQEIFLRLWHEPHRYDPTRGSLRSYLLADAHGRSVDLVRREVARRGREARE